MIPSAWPFALLALAAWRVWRLVAEDTILDPIRYRVMARFPSKGFAEFMDCPFCSGAWIASAWWVAWLFSPHWTTLVAVPFALSATVAFVAMAGHRLTND